MRRHSSLATWSGLVLCLSLCHLDALADSSCSATNSNGDKKCSVTCPTGQSASCSDATGSNPPDCHCNASQPNTRSQFGIPLPLSPYEPGSFDPQLLWTEVPGATQYKITIGSKSHVCPPPLKSSEHNLRRTDKNSMLVDPGHVCSHDKCGFTLRFDDTHQPTYPRGVTPADPQSELNYCATDTNNAPVTFTWTVQALFGQSAGPESEAVSYSPPPPLLTTYTVTCVFQTGSNYWAWYNGRFAPFVNIWGQVNPGVIGKSFTFTTPTFQNCNGLVNGATPVNTATFTVNAVGFCTNLINSAQETFINLTCPETEALHATYRAFGKN